MTTPIASDPLVIDSSGWLEYITADTRADEFAPFLQDTSRILIPTMVLYEVRKVLLLRHTKTLADAFVSQAFLLQIVVADASIALSAVHLSIQHQLSMGDAFIYASTLAKNATLVTSDAHFQNLPSVRLV